MSGAEAQNRTGDTRIFSPLLYRLSYLGTLVIVAGITIKIKLFAFHSVQFIFSNRYMIYSTNIKLPIF
jgi:hypothetical protein